MKRKSWEISRRTCLRGVGTAIGLPVLEAMVPGIKRARAAGAPAPTYGFWFVTNGGTPDWGEAMPGCFFPRSTGKDYDTTKILKPLVDPAPNGLGLRDDLLVIRNLHNAIGEIGPEEAHSGGDHMRGLGALLTAVDTNYIDHPNRSAATSVDQRAAQVLKQYTPALPYILVGSGLGHTEDGTLAWASPTQALNETTQPSEIFTKVFGDGTIDAVTAKKRMDRRLSVLHYANVECKRIQTKLGTQDKMTLESYLQQIGEVESSIKAAGSVTTSCKMPPASLGDASSRVDYSYDSVPSIMKQMVDLIALAFQCDRTRVATLYTRNRGWHFRWLPAPFNQYVDWHADIEHGVNTARLYGTPDRDDRVETYALGAQWMLENLYGHLLTQLKGMKMPDGRGTYLDNTIAVWSPELSYGNGHYMRDLPILVGGRGSGAVNPGRYIQAPNAKFVWRNGEVVGGSPVANLWVSMLNALGIKDTTFGNSTEPLNLL